MSTVSNKRLISFGRCCQVRATRPRSHQNERQAVSTYAGDRQTIGKRRTALAHEHPRTQDLLRMWETLVQNVYQLSVP